MADLLPIPLYHRAGTAALATVTKSPWVVVVPTLALGMGTLADWLLVPLGNVGIIAAAPVKALLWSVALYVWRRVLLEGEVARAEVEAELVARARSRTALGMPLLFGTVAFLTLAYGGALASLFVMAVVLLPALEALLLGGARPLGAVFKEHGAAWAVSQFILVSVSMAAWLVVVMVAGAFHVLAGEVLSALVGGPMMTALWLVRGHAWFALNVEPVVAAPAPKPKVVAKPAAPKVAPGTRPPGPKSPGAKPPAPKKPGPPRRA
jgi:hypothetical protein